jgi:iron-sulfur cluster repair protein YtfE (RIC family)
MRHGPFLKTSIAIFASVVLTLPHLTAAQSRATETTMTTSTIHIPQSVQAEHEAIHATLVEATQAPGRVGTAAKALAEVLHPHFVREEQIALPPLGLLAPLATGDHLPETVVSEALTMTDALKSELPRMLEEHKKIHAAVDTLRLVARAEQATKYEQLAEQLALHAQTEEEVLYPAAVLVGDIIRARRQSK